ncbi:hypothetical protein [Actinotalea sp. K2]|uniref:hypothetical protein n=1 Tax=Actinotalea sp. K2 TaxID=2939438 RepID=UPI00201711EB|nr:hypothetical protein [Actinotalea sp. K2]MCL3860660.1 hypothetical protein [Actinotalea sp. K2]
MRRVTGAGVVAFSLLLVGCGGTGGPDPDPPGPTAPSPTVSPAQETPEPTVSSSGDARPALEDLVLSTSGLGPLEIGEPPAENSGAAMITWDAEHCEVLGEEYAEPGRWVPAGYEWDVVYSGEQAQPFYVDATDEAVYRIDVMSVSPATGEGIRIGSSLEELQEAYPELEGPFEGPVSRVWWLQDEDGSLVFETQGEQDGLRPAGTPESVILVRVLVPDYSPEFATANSGDVAGACF